MQIANRLISRTVSRLPENNNASRITQPEETVERTRFLWETLHRPVESALKLLADNNVLLEKATNPPDFPA